MKNGTVETVKYGKTTIDHIPMSDVIKFSNS